MMRLRRTGCILLLLFAAWFCRAEQFGEISIEMVPGMIEEPRGETGCFIREFRLPGRLILPIEDREPERYGF